MHRKGWPCELQQGAQCQGMVFNNSNRCQWEKLCAPDVGSSMKMTEGLATSSTAMVSRFLCSTESPEMPGRPTKDFLRGVSSTSSSTCACFQDGPTSPLLSCAQSFQYLSNEPKVDSDGFLNLLMHPPRAHYLRMGLQVPCSTVHRAFQLPFK